MIVGDYSCICFGRTSRVADQPLNCIYFRSYAISIGTLKKFQKEEEFGSLVFETLDHEIPMFQPLSCLIGDGISSIWVMKELEESQMDLFK